MHKFNVDKAADQKYDNLSSFNHHYNKLAVYQKNENNMIYEKKEQ